MTDTPPEAQAIERVRLELVTRKFMIMVLAMIGVWVGIAMMLTGAPSFLEEWFSPWSRYFIGGAAFVGGIVTSAGGSIGDGCRKGWWTQVTGLTIMTLWYFAMGGAYLCLNARIGVPLVGPGEPLDSALSGRGYVPIVYFGLMIMTATPLVTMFTLQRPGVMSPRD